MIAGKCPYCSGVVTRLNGHALTVSFGGDAQYKAVSYQCPACNAVLGCQIDPLAVVGDIAKAVKRELGRA